MNVDVAYYVTPCAYVLTIEESRKMSAKRPYDPIQVANAVIGIAKKDGRTISPLHLQKLIYYAHGWSLAIFDEALINEELEAWKYGPVIPRVYHEFKYFGSAAIDRPATCIDVAGNEITPTVPEDDKLTWQLLEKVWEVYKGYRAIELSQISHAPGSPWQTAWNSRFGMSSVTISNESIKDYFVTKK